MSSNYYFDTESNLFQEDTSNITDIFRQIEATYLKHGLNSNGKHKNKNPNAKTNENAMKKENRKSKSESNKLQDTINKIIFFHIHKAGGTSIRHFLKENYYVKQKLDSNSDNNDDFSLIFYESNRSFRSICILHY